MKKNIFIAITFILSHPVLAQKVGRITLTMGNADVITYEADKTLLINISKDGNIISWGTEDSWGKQLKYMGREEYYSATDDSASRGKVKYIGIFQITYYASYDDQLLKGKIKSIGSANFDYYMSFEDEAVKGKIKDIGATAFSYYPSFDNEAYKGKIKTVGGTNITYYASFDDKAYKGKVKSIGNFNFSYYSSFDRKEYVGSMKPGASYSPYVNGIKYLIR